MDQAAVASKKHVSNAVRKHGERGRISHLHKEQRVFAR
jgi:hypothetical protein